MSYRSLTRVLGETRLERKCRWLFAGCILLLVGGAFILVDRIAKDLVDKTEDQIMKNTRTLGRDQVDILLLKTHLKIWDTTSDPKTGKGSNPNLAKLSRIVSEQLDKQNYDYEILAINDPKAVFNLNAKLPDDQDETDILSDLKRQMEPFDLHQLEHLHESPTTVESPSPTASTGQEKEAIAKLPYAENWLSDRSEYHYYEPIVFKSTCLSCHGTLRESGALPAAAGLFEEDSPLRVIKVTIPYKETDNAISRVRAILIAVAILTVFLSMIVLYAIFRYVVVRPLQHLRDVSDAVGQGKTELRAEIHTGDEFQELSDSFNRMLRHMTEAQAALENVNVDLDGKVDQLAQLNMRLHEMNRLKSDFLANMSHELRTPLNSIIGFSEVLQGIDSLDDKQLRYAENIQKSGRLLLEMINDILDLAKMEAGKMEVRPTQCSGMALVSAQCDLVRSLAEEKNIDLNVRVQSEQPPLYQDQVKIQQVLTNLLSNAIKFTPEGGRITVTGLRNRRGEFEITVADTGVGIAEEDYEVIFEKFRQSKAVLDDGGLTREYAGTGLGLSIVKELCKLLGGEITFTSELGKGSTFVVTLPWTLANQPEHQMQIASKLDAIARPRPSDVERGSDPPVTAPSIVSAPASMASGSED